MIELGMKQQVVGVSDWLTLRIRGNPKKMPDIPKGYELVCGLDQGAGEKMIICETLAQMEALYHEYITGHAVHISWYQKPAAAETATVA